MIFSKINKKGDFPPSLVILLIGVFVLIFLLFGEDTNISSPSSSEQIINKSKISLPSIYLTTEKDEKLLISIPFIVLENNFLEKSYEFYLNDNFDYLESFYQIEKIKNCNLQVYLDDYLISYDRLGRGYYKLLEKPLFENKDKIKIRFVCEKKGNFLFGQPQAIIKDFVINGYKKYDKVKLTFRAEPKDYIFQALVTRCNGENTLEIQVNNCPAYIKDVKCNSVFKYKIPEVCLNEESAINTLNIRILKGKLSLVNVSLISLEE